MISQETFQAMKSLAVEECANYLGRGPGGRLNFCWARGKSQNGKCEFFKGDAQKVCQYFEEIVLPINEELMEELKDERSETGKLDSGEKSGKGAGNVKVVSDKVAEARVSLPKVRR